MIVEESNTDMKNVRSSPKHLLHLTTATTLGKFGVPTSTVLPRGSNNFSIAASVSGLV